MYIKELDCEFRVALIYDVIYIIYMYSSYSIYLEKMYFSLGYAYSPLSFSIFLGSLVSGQ